MNGLAVDPREPRRMWVAMRAGIFRSVDAGKTWTAATGGPREVAAVAVNPAKPGDLVAATAEGRIFVSTDGGSTWQPR